MSDFAPLFNTFVTGALVWGAAAYAAAHFLDSSENDTVSFEVDFDVLVPFRWASQAEASGARRWRRRPGRRLRALHDRVDSIEDVWDAFSGRIDGVFDFLD